MNWQTNPAMIGLRNVARKTGVIQFINQFLPRKKYYEQTFDTAMFEAIKPGEWAPSVSPARLCALRLSWLRTVRWPGCSSYPIALRVAQPIF